MSFVYLASPYSHVKPKIRHERYLKAVYACSLLAKESVPVYCPIVAWHKVAEHYSLPSDAVFWALQNRAFLKACSKILVLRIPGWDSSRGVREELRWAKEFGKPSAPFFLER